MNRQLSCIEVQYFPILTIIYLSYFLQTSISKDFVYNVELLQKARSLSYNIGEMYTYEVEMMNIILRKQIEILGSLLPRYY